MSAARQLHIDVVERAIPNAIRRELILKADGDADAIKIFYETDDVGIGAPVVLDGFLQGVLLHCMKRGLPVRIHGNLSELASHNLHEFQRVWAIWKPDLYRHVDLIPDAVVNVKPASDRVIQAFSGGVDATFTLISNKALHRDRGGYDVSAAVLVHGFDVHYENTRDFDMLAQRLRTSLARHGIALKTMRTNSRALNIQSWMDSFTSQLAACLHQFSNHYGVALMASAKSYDELEMGISSNPITDPLLSGDTLRMVHDGAGYTRTEKVEVISRYPELVEHLKVCWQGTVQHSNCGKCEKCLRTRLNFAAAGEMNPACFPGAFNTKMLGRLKASSMIQLEELRSILSYIRHRRLDYHWTHQLRRRIALSRLGIELEKLFKLQAAMRWVRTSLRGAPGHS